MCLSNPSSSQAKSNNIGMAQKTFLLQGKSERFDSYSLCQHHPRDKCHLGYIVRF